MKSISLKIDETTFIETEDLISILKISRNRYINEALASYNKVHKRKVLAKRMKEQSELVRSESMKVLKEFEDIDYAD